LCYQHLTQKAKAIIVEEMKIFIGRLYTFLHWRLTSM